MNNTTRSLRAATVAAAIIGVLGTISLTKPALATQAWQVMANIVHCNSTSACVDGANAGTGPGVTGTSRSGGGVAGTSAFNDGMDATTTNPSSRKQPRSGLFGYDASTDGGYLNNGVAGYSTTGIGVSGTALNVGIGVSATAPLFVFMGFDPQGQNVFEVDGGGNVHISGEIYTAGQCSNGCVKGVGGKRLVSYTPHESSPMIEDVGKGRLISGRAAVRLDPTFASGIDERAGYAVFTEAEGDNRGLYVMAKTASGFVVRESQGGRSTLDFSYRIVAKPFGSKEKRMSIVDMRTLPGAGRAPHLTMPSQAHP